MATFSQLSVVGVLGTTVLLLHGCGNSSSGTSEQTALWNQSYKYPIDLSFSTDSTIVTQTNGVLHCLDSKNGSQMWSFDTDNGWLIAVDPDDTVFTLSKLIGPWYSQFLIALHGRNGSLKWNFSSELGAIGSAMVVAGTIFVEFKAGSVQALDKASGSIIWTHNVTSGYPELYPMATPELLTPLSPLMAWVSERYWPDGVAGGEVLIYDGANITALNENGGIMWTRNICSPQCEETGDSAEFRVDQGPSYDGNGTIYMSSFNREVLALRLEDGHILWNVSLKHKSDYFDYSTIPLIGKKSLEGIIYMAEVTMPYSQNCSVLALRQRDGAVLWKYSIDGGFRQPMLFSYDGTVYVTGRQFHALDGKTGSLKWQSYLGNMVFWPTIDFAGDVVYLPYDLPYNFDDNTSSHTHHVAALHSVDGSVKWDSQVGGTFSHEVPQEDDPFALLPMYAKIAYNGTVVIQSNNTIAAFPGEEVVTWISPVTPSPTMAEALLV